METIEATLKLLIQGGGKYGGGGEIKKGIRGGGLFVYYLDPSVATSKCFIFLHEICIPLSLSAGSFWAFKYFIFSPTTKYFLACRRLERLDVYFLVGPPDTANDQSLCTAILGAFKLNSVTFFLFGIRACIRDDETVGRSRRIRSASHNSP